MGPRAGRDGLGGLGLEPAVEERLRRFQGMVLAANRRVNLTAIRAPEEFWRKQILDSLAGWPEAVGGDGGRTKVLDLGSGAGLPGIPLAIADGSLQMTLLDASERRVRFLERAVRELDLPIRVLHGRAEDLGRDAAHRDGYDRVLVRAVAPLRTLVELGLPLVRPGGRLVAWKGPAAAAEIEAAGRALAEVRGRVASTRRFVLPAGGLPPADCLCGSSGDVGADRRAILAIEKSDVTPDRFPRRPGVPARRPL